MPRIDYRLKDGRRVSGVTTIISGNLGWNKQQLLYWAWNEGREGRDFRETSDAAASAGIIAHEMIAADLRGKNPDEIIAAAEKLYSAEIRAKAEGSFYAWLEWKSLFDFTLLENEKSLVSEEYGFGGTIDIASVKKVSAIIDLKTSNGIYPDHRIQISAYGKLWNENHPDSPIRAYYLLQLGKEDGSFHYHYWPSLEKEWKAFLNLLELHNLKKEIGK